MKRTLLLALALSISAPLVARAQDKAAPAATAPAPAAVGGSAATAAPAKKGKKGPMDINTASADELKTLPGIDDATAQKIIAGRPYRGKDDLLKQAIVDKDEYAKIRPLIHAKQAKVAPAAAAPAAAAPPPAAPAPAAKPADKPAK